MVSNSRSSLCRRVPEAGDPSEVVGAGWQWVETLRLSRGPDLEFGYGASGQRTEKTVGDPADEGYREHYIRDAQGNIMATYRYSTDNGASLKVNDRPLYGSSRLGTWGKEEELFALSTFDPNAGEPVQQVDLNYELTDHLGNVTTVITGRLLAQIGFGVQYQAELVSNQGYEPFGSLLPGRNYSSDSYRFGGAGGQEKDDEIYGATGTSYTAEFWQYDPRTGRRWNMDPLGQFSSSYLTFANNPIIATDPTGAWVPEVTETSTTNKDGTTTKSGFLSARIEDGDNAESLSKFLSIGIDEATTLFDGMGENKTLAVPEAIAAPINAEITFGLQNPDHYGTGLFDGENFNCFTSATAISRGNRTNKEYLMTTYEFARRIASEYDDVSDTPEQWKFGRTVVTFGHDALELELQTTHAATYLGASKDGTVYFWTKNGRKTAPVISIVGDLPSSYGPVRGVSFGTDGGGYYNFNPEKSKIGAPR